MIPSAVRSPSYSLLNWCSWSLATIPVYLTYGATNMRRKDYEVVKVVQCWRKQTKLNLVSSSLLRRTFFPSMFMMYRETTLLSTHWERGVDTRNLWGASDSSWHTSQLLLFSLCIHIQSERRTLCLPVSIEENIESVCGWKISIHTVKLCFTKRNLRGSFDIRVSHFSQER